MLRVTVACVIVVCVAGCQGRSTVDPNVVARAGSSELTVARLAEIAASFSELPVQPDVIESIAMRWVEYSLLGLRTAAGDRLTDSETILAVAWPDVLAAVIDSFRTVRMAGRVYVTSAQVDSAFHSDDVRFLKQILKRTTPATTAVERESLRAVISGIREHFAAGGSWEEANAQNDDPRARAANGAMGLVSRGQTVPPFENAAFALAPGQLSGVVETSFGFHLVYRPELEEIRDEFASGLRDLFALPLDSVYEEELVVRKSVEMVEGLPAAVRYTAASPLRARGMDRVLATYDGGQFTVGDLARWLQFLPPQFFQQVRGAADDELVSLTRSFVVRELKWQEADSAGVRLSDERYQQIATAYTEQLNQILAVTGLDPDSLTRAASSHGGRQREAARLVDRFMTLVVQDPRLGPPMPPGLANHLLETGDWEVSRQGVEMVVLETAMLRSVRVDSTGQRGGP